MSPVEIGSSMLQRGDAEGAADRAGGRDRQLVKSVGRGRAPLPAKAAHRDVERLHERFLRGVVHALLQACGQQLHPLFDRRAHE